MTITAPLFAARSTRGTKSRNCVLTTLRTVTKASAATVAMRATSRSLMLGPVGKGGTIERFIGRSGQGLDNVDVH